MEKYLTEGDLSVDELEGAVAKAVDAGTVIPIFCTAGKREIGVTELLHALAKYSSTPWHAKAGSSSKASRARAACKPH